MIQIKPVTYTNQNRHQRGEDRPAGTVVYVAGFFICPRETKFLENLKKKVPFWALKVVVEDGRKILSGGKTLLPAVALSTGIASIGFRPPTGQNPFPGETPEYPLLRRKFDRMEELI